MKRSPWLLIPVIATGACLLALGCEHQPTQAESDFIARLGETSITVYPAYVRVANTGEYDSAAADAFAKFLQDEKLARVVVSADRPPIESSWHHNQSKMWRQNCEAFGEYVKSKSIDTDYALMAEYLKGSADGVAGGVHVYVVTKDGERAFGVGLNNHHAVFQRHNPRTAAECTKTAIDSLKEQLDEARSKPKK